MLSKPLQNYVLIALPRYCIYAIRRRLFPIVCGPWNTKFMCSHLPSPNPMCILILIMDFNNNILSKPWDHEIPDTFTALWFSILCNWHMQSGWNFLLGVKICFTHWNKVVQFISSTKWKSSWTKCQKTPSLTLLPTNTTDFKQSVTVYQSTLFRNNIIHRLERPFSWQFFI